MVTVGGEGEALTQLLSALPLAYMAACCYYSLFQLGMFSFYHIVPHATNAHSLLMNAAQVGCCLHKHMDRALRYAMITQCLAAVKLLLLPVPAGHVLFLPCGAPCHQLTFSPHNCRPGGLPSVGLTLY